MIDILIKNAKIVDGSGSPWYKGDIAIEDGKIKVIGKLDNVEASRVIDAAGRVVSPGFIDIHTHSDLTLLVNGRAESKIRQGVTTEVIGNCGSSPAPISGSFAEELAQELEEDYGLNLDWSSYPQYLDRLNKIDLNVNVVPIVGHGALRRTVMGYQDRKTTASELEEMKGLLAEAMEAGAFGFSSGLIYPPSSYADTEELIELAKIAAAHEGIYTTHMRHEGDKLIEGVREAVKIGRESGIPVQISHHKVSSRASWGLVNGSLAMLHWARERGVDVTCDVYPYLATSTGLNSIIPDWAHEGGKDKMLERIESKTDRERIIDHLQKNQAPRGWENIVVAGVYSDKNEGLEGKSIAEIAEIKGTEPAVTVLELLTADEARTGMIRFAMCEDDVKRVLADDLTMVGSDASSKADYGPLAEGKPHPRAFGTFPRVLGKYSREENVISLEKAVFKMTGLPAWRLGLSSKGLLKQGMDADITIFSPEKVQDKATFVDPFQYPEGIEQVIVNGHLTIDEGKHLNPASGSVLS